MGAQPNKERIKKMKSLNKNATIVFGKLMDSLKGDQHRKIHNEPFMPLTIERGGKDITTPWGLANLYSLCHYYEQNGDLMADPEMCFVVVDEREDEFLTDWDKLNIVPYLFKQDSLGIYEESIFIENKALTKYHSIKQKGHTEFADTWLLNIQQQGFLKRL